MPFQKGKSGCPGGRRAEKPWVEALKLAASEKIGDRTKLREMADVTMNMALDGNLGAIQEIGNRLDGKPVQQVEATATVNKESLDDYTRDELTALEQALLGAIRSASADSEDRQGANESDSVH